MSRPLSIDVIVEAQMIAGLQKNQSTSPQLVVLGKPCKVSDCVSVLQDRAAVVAAVPPAEVVWHAAVKARDDKAAQTNAFVASLKQQLVASYSNAPDGLAAYGLLPKKTAATKPAIKVVAAVKSRATRTARGTRGPKQKKEIKGAIGSTVSIDVAAPSTPPTVSPSPAPIAASAVSASSAVATPGSSK